ncbi:MAG TPA: cytochrome P450 [Rhizomicrobium sp.]|nr:cytochrome P450 [Rhizomicrobium sp.]
MVLATTADFRPAAPIPHKHTPTTWRFLLDLARNPVEAFGDFAYEEPYVYKRSWIRHFLMVNDPDGARHVLLDNAANYIKSDQVQKRIRAIAGNGLLTAEGASWRFQRRTASPMFHARMVSAFAPMMAEATEELLSRWSRLPEGAEIELAQEMMKLTFDIISRTMFSNEVTIDYHALAHAMETYLDTMGRVDPLDILGVPQWVPTPNRVRARPALKFIRRELENLIAQRRAKIAADPSSAPNDLLTLLLTTKDPEEGALFSNAEVFDNVATFIFAGHETTANALAWTFYLLSQAGADDARVAREAADILKGRSAGSEDVPALVFTRAVIEESMRLYPPAPILSRDSIGPDKIGPVNIEANTSVVVSPWIIQRHRKLWKAPDYFMPERFMPGEREKIHRFAYIPFGAGPRICIGMGFAMTEAVVILSTIAQRYRLDLSPGFVVAPQARITLRPKYGLKMRVFKR